MDDERRSLGSTVENNEYVGNDREKRDEPPDITSSFSSSRVDVEEQPSQTANERTATGNAASTRQEISSALVVSVIILLNN